MKNLLICLLVLFSGTVAVQAQTKESKTGKAKVEVYYFHRTNRCGGCIAMEKNTKKTLETYFSKEVEEGTVKFIIANIDEEKNEPLAEEYKVYGSSLFVTKIDGINETRTNMTNFAFSYGKNNPEKFMKGLKEKIDENLK
ncbi:MAG: nitrophenyl compound nitroreductase subunit ArsF family protein [Bacteroidota bacterium]